MNRKEILVVFFGDRPKKNCLGFYEILRWAKGIYAHIFVVDKYYNNTQDETLYGVTNIRSEEFDPRLHNKEYLLVNNFPQPGGFATFVTRLTRTKTQFEIVLVTQAGLKIQVADDHEHDR